MKVFFVSSFPKTFKKREQNLISRGLIFAGFKQNRETRELLSMRRFIHVRYLYLYFSPVDYLFSS